MSLSSLIALKISIDKVPKWIEPESNKIADLRIVLQAYFMKYNFCELVYEYQTFNNSA